MMTASTFRLRHRRRGSLYVMVLGGSLAVAVVGLSAVTVMRVERESCRGAADLLQARLYAQSAVEVAQRIIVSDPTWRTTYPNGDWKTNQVIGNGLYSVSCVDPTDGVLPDAQSEPIKITGTGVSGQARYILETTMIAEPTPLEALKKALVSNGSVQVDLLKKITVSGSSLATNASVNNLGTIVGNVEAVLGSVSGTLVGTLTQPAPTQTLPPAEAISLYQDMATPLPSVSIIEKALLSPSQNPYGTPQIEGVYFLDAGDQDVTIENVRVLGTLMVRVGTGRKVILDKANFMEAYNPKYPALIVDGSAEIKQLSSTQALQETSIGCNLNPPGAEYQGASDTDIDDSYPNEIRGLVHVKGNLTLSGTSRINGVVLVEGTTTVSGDVQIAYDASIYARAPLGYATYAMTVSPGSWRRIVLP